MSQSYFKLSCWTQTPEHEIIAENLMKQVMFAYVSICVQTYVCIHAINTSHFCIWTMQKWFFSYFNILWQSNIANIIFWGTAFGERVGVHVIFQDIVLAVGLVLCGLYSVKQQINAEKHFRGHEYFCHNGWGMLIIHLLTLLHAKNLQKDRK